ncbi:hypothetical protein PoB_001213300 [Plakobranchus ocellatus]|uniref:Uncharacterized protein n=1 Tax=Plakobranchus ocellatus TaxID=259542 RepID=A0AAV3YTR0_9GAST|nr:hypothetical protein PoB_001213300 [Plakobranchus ocellatus]
MARGQLRGLSPQQKGPCRSQGGFAIHCATDASRGGREGFGEFTRAGTMVLPGCPQTHSRRLGEFIGQTGQELFHYYNLYSLVTKQYTLPMLPSAACSCCPSNCTSANKTHCDYGRNDSRRQQQSPPALDYAMVTPTAAWHGQWLL